MLRKFDTAKDFDLLVAGEVEAFTNSYPGSTVPLDLVTSRIRSIERKRVSCTVLDEGEPMGYVVFSKRTDGTIVDIYVESLYLAPRARGAGNVEKLLNSIVQTHAHSRITLDVTASNEPAVASYESLGFKVERLRMTKSYPTQGGTHRDT